MNNIFIVMFAGILKGVENIYENCKGILIFKHGENKNKFYFNFKNCSTPRYMKCQKTISKQSTLTCL
jgi:hypothetical protein